MSLLGNLFGLGGGKPKGTPADHSAAQGDELLNRPARSSSGSIFASSPRQSSSGGIMPQNLQLNTNSGGSNKQNSKLDATQKQSYLFSCNSSIEANKARRFLGERIRENSVVSKRLGIDSGEGLKRFVVSATGKGDYFRSEQARKDRNFFREGKIGKTSVYAKASPCQQRVMRNDRDTQKYLGSIYEDMFKK